MKLNSIVLLYKIIVLNSHYKYSRCITSCPVYLDCDTACISDISFPLTIGEFKSIKLNELMIEWYKVCGHISCDTCSFCDGNVHHCGVQSGIKKLINK